MSAGPICPECGGAGGVIVPIPGDMPTTGPCKTCAPTADPSKVNALRKLTEAAEAIGWSAGVDTDGDPFLASGGSGCFEVYVSEGFIYAVNGWADTPVELMALLLEAAQ